MSGWTHYPRDRQRECAQRGYHIWLPRLVQPNSSATMLPSEWRDCCVTCKATR